MGPAEQVEGRERAKGNVAEETSSRTPRRGLLSQALSRVRQAPADACTSTRGKSPVWECRTPGSVRGVLGNRHPYRDCQRHYEDQSLQCTMLLGRARVASLYMSDCGGNCREHVARIES
jgi:hypothetical protein